MYNVRVAYDKREKRRGRELVYLRHKNNTHPTTNRPHARWYPTRTPLCSALKRTSVSFDFFGHTLQMPPVAAPVTLVGFGSQPQLVFTEFYHA